MTNTPENLKLRLFDPKQVEFSSYSDSSHLAHPVVLDKEEAVIRLKELEHLMNERYVQLKDLGLKDIEAYNLFHQFLLLTVQINGSFYSNEGIELALDPLVEKMLAKIDPTDAFIRARTPAVVEAGALKYGS